MKRIITTPLACGLLDGLLISCSDTDSGAIPPLQVPTTIDDSWETAHPSTVGLDADRLAKFVADIRTGRIGDIHSLVIVKDDKLVVDEYFTGTSISDVSLPLVDSNTPVLDYNRDHLHQQHSVTKSFTSALIGIAIDQQLISGPDALMVDLLPQHVDTFDSPQKQQLTLEHFLTMTTGLQWDEWSLPYSDSRNDHASMSRSSEPIRFVLGQPLIANPGTYYVYNSGGSTVLGAVIANASPLDTDEFAEQYLFQPLGIEDYFWARYASGAIHSGGGLGLRPRDMAKFGYLYLNGGRWQGNQIISESWVEQSTKVHSYETRDVQYGYQWRLNTSNYSIGDDTVDVVWAEGLGGQYIFYVPDADMVVVFTSWLGYGRGTYLPRGLLAEYILSAVI